MTRSAKVENSLENYEEDLAVPPAKELVLSNEQFVSEANHIFK